MIVSIETVLRRFRRRLTRSEWLARILGLAASEASTNAAGLVLIQIDGLSRPELERALERGEMPFLKRLLTKQHYQLKDLYAGVPSSTPAAQGELFYGVKQAVPGFGFMERRSGELVRMYEPGIASRVEKQLQREGSAPLLKGGSCYASIFCAGADEPHFCPASMGWGPALRNAKPLAVILLLVTHIWSLLRTAVLLVVELVLALIDCVRGLIQGQDLAKELLFVPTRIVITILMRELATIGAAIDIARGLPIIFLDYLGYDEQAHRRGPDSAFAHWTLKGIDRCIARLWRAAHRSKHRHYDVWIFSDHGQEKSRPWQELNGQPFAEALSAAIAQYEQRPVAFRSSGHRGVQLQRVRLFGGRRVQRLFPIDEPQQAITDGEPISVSTLGPIAMLYLPKTQIVNSAAMAQLIVEATAAPLVLYKATHPDRKSEVLGWCAEGEVSLPQDGMRLVGADHPFAEEVVLDLVELCHHPDSGDFVICGWRAAGSRGNGRRGDSCRGDNSRGDIRAISFAQENGAHGGIGPHETHAFALLPADIVSTGRQRSYWRFVDLRRAVRQFLHSSPGPETVRKARDAAAARSLRVMTYNVHRCVGVDGKLSPERVARVIARHEPDIVALQELDVERARTGGVDQAHEIARLLQMEYHFHPSFKVQEERYGDAILSHLPMRLVHTGALPGSSGRIPFEPRGALWVAVEHRGREVQVINTHLGLSPAERRRQVEALLGPDWLGHPDCQEPRILCGDLNTGPRSAVYRRLQTQLDDAQRMCPEHSPRATFFSRLPRVRIDHIFTGGDLQVLNVEVPRTELAQLASDHLAVLVELELL